jgi:hypothetical protein
MKTTNPLTDADIQLIRFLRFNVNSEAYDVAYDIYRKSAEIRLVADVFYPRSFLRISVRDEIKMLYNVSHYREKKKYEGEFIENAVDGVKFINATESLRIFACGGTHNFLTPA